MPKLLIAAFEPTGLAYVSRARALGLDVRVLDCFDTHHQQLHTWYGEAVLHVQGRRSDVTDRVAAEGFDVAVVDEDRDYVRAALIVQSLRAAGIETIVAITRDPAKRALYRRCGAHRVIVASDAEQAWALLTRFLPKHMPA